MQLDREYNDKTQRWMWNERKWCRVTERNPQKTPLWFKSYRPANCLFISTYCKSIWQPYFPVEQERILLQLFFSGLFRFFRFLPIFQALPPPPLAVTFSVKSQCVYHCCTDQSCCHATLSSLVVVGGGGYKRQGKTKTSQLILKNIQKAL